MPSQRRPRVCFAAPAPRALVSCCAGKAADPLDRPSDAVAAVPRPRARLSVVRVRELEVRAAARSADLRVTEAAETLLALEGAADPAAAATTAAALAESLQREVRALRRLNDARVERGKRALEALLESAQVAAHTSAAAAETEAAAGTEGAVDDERNAETAPPVASALDADTAVDDIVGSMRTSVTRGGVELVRRAESVRIGIGERVTEFVRDDGTIDFKGLRAILGAALDSVGGVWMRLNGRVPKEQAMLTAGEEPDDGFPPVSDEEEQFRLRELINVLERELQAASKAREDVLRKEDQLGKLIRAKEIRAMDDIVSAVRRTLAVRVLQLEMEKIFVSLAEEIERSSVDLVSEQRLMVAEFGELDERLLEMCVFIDNGEPALVQDDALGDVASDIQYLKTRLGLDATLYTSTTLDWMQVRQFVAVSVKKTRAGIEFYARGLRLFIGDLQYAARLIRRAIGGYTPTPREVRTLRRTGRDLFTLIPFTIILIAPLTPVGHVLIFSFLQRYWPDFFPSTFSERRQALMKRYENYAKSLSDDADAPKNSPQELNGAAGKSSADKGLLSRFPVFGRWFSAGIAKDVIAYEEEAAANAANVAAAEERVFEDVPKVDILDDLSENVDVAVEQTSPAMNATDTQLKPTQPGFANGVATKTGTKEAEKQGSGGGGSIQGGLRIDDLHLAD